MVTDPLSFWRKNGMIIFALALAAIAGAVGILFATFQAVGGVITGQDVRRYLLAMALVAGGLLVFAWFCIGLLLIRSLSFRLAMRRGATGPTEYVDAWKSAGQRLELPDDED